ncbi:MAG: glycosyltransferase family 2 protein [Desulfobulbus sp.]|jgi:glycosyltransferase involved in cell wall biosynthesis|nr:glycosyltransferase family 2 protein [Desulfobulbus sp.]
MPLISVVIPTFNRACYVTSAIDSVLAQTFSDYEIIVVDDGSKDNTGEIIQPYLNKINYFYQPNSGVSAARNAGIRVAKGEWIAFLDSDDEWLPRKLELQIKDLQKYPDAVLSCTNIIFEGLPGTLPINCFSSCLFLEMYEVLFIKEPFFKCYAFTPTVVARRQTIIDVGMFNEDLAIYEDGDLFFRLSTKGGFVVNPLVLVKSYRRSETADLNLSTQFSKNKVKYYTNVIKSFEKYNNLDLNFIQKKHIKEKLSSTWFDLGLVYYGLKNTSLARNCFLTCFQVNPSLKNFLKLFLGLSGPLGLNYIQKRRIMLQGFRRSEYYQNGFDK